MIAKHCRDEAIANNVKSYEPTDNQVKDRCTTILHTYRSTLDIREDLYKEIKQNKEKGMAGPSNLQMQAQFYLYKVMKVGSSNKGASAWGWSLFYSVSTFGRNQYHRKLRTPHVDSTFGRIQYHSKLRSRTE